MTLTNSIMIRAKESHVPQSSLVDDGIASLTAAVRYLGGDVQPEMMKEICQKSGSGITLLDLHKAAQSLGFQSHAYKANIQQLLAVEAPVILHITSQNGSQQFNVCYGFYSPWFLIGDPALGIRKMMPKDVVAIWQSGVLLTLEPGPDFTRIISRLKGDFDFGATNIFSSNAKYCCDDIVLHQVGSEKIIIHSKRTGSNTFASTQEAQLLSLLSTFDKLKNHRAYILRSVFNSEKHINSTKTGKKIHDKSRLMITNTLKEFVRNGFLVSEEEIISEIISCHERYLEGYKENAPRGNLNTICIPTCDRPELLKRAVMSYVKNSIKCGRKIEVIVSDDSSKKSNQIQNQNCLKKIQEETGAAIRYITQKNRKEFAQTLSDYADISPEVIQYGLLGENSLFSTGASRNTLLLATAGKRSVQIDDDTYCHIAVSNDRGSGLRVSSGKEIYDFWFHSNFESSLNDISAEYYDFLTLHENLLGKSPHKIIDDKCGNIQQFSLDGIREEILMPFRESSSKVDITIFGSMGDSGNDENGNVGRLFLEGDSLDRLIQTENGYGQNMRTRYVNKVVSEPTLTNNPHFMSMNIGLDGCELLPPFMPVFRNEDSVFGAVHTYAFRNGYKLHLPYMIAHKPPDRPTHSIDISELIRSPRTNDILNWLILSKMDDLRSADNARNLIALGHRLREYGTLKTAEFLDYVYQMALQIIGSSLMQIEQKLSQNHDAPDYWKQDVQVYLQIYRSRVLDRSFFVPRDIKGDQETRIEELLRHIGMYGKLLCYWPELTEAARHISPSNSLVRA